MVRLLITSLSLLAFSGLFLSAHGMATTTGACITEGNMTNGPVPPEYQTSCCTGLKAVSPPSDNTTPIVGGGMICVKEEITACSMEYAPICGQPPMPACLEGMMCPQMMPIPQTYSNNCMLSADNASKLYNGECKAPTPRSQTQLSSSIIITMDKAVYGIFSKHLGTDKRLNTEGQSLASKLTERIETVLAAHAEIMSRSKYTARGLIQATNKGAMLQYLHDYISKLLIPRSQCKRYYDGCNSCSIRENGTDACTRMACKLSAPKIPYCTMTKQ